MCLPNRQGHRCFGKQSMALASRSPLGALLAASAVRRRAWLPTLGPRCTCGVATHRGRGFVKSLSRGAASETQHSHWCNGPEMTPP